MVWLSPSIQPLHVRELLNPHNAIFQHEDLDSGEEDADVVDHTVNDASIENLDDTPNIERVRRVHEVRVLPTNSEPFHESSIRPVPLY